jgi:hypothetical protein
MTLYDIIRKLTGPIEATGEHNEDQQRLKNLKEVTLLVDRLLFDVGEAAHDADREEESMQAIGQHAQKFLGDTRNALEN